MTLFVMVDDSKTFFILIPLSLEDLSQAIKFRVDLVCLLAQINLTP